MQDPNMYMLHNELLMRQPKSSMPRLYLKVHWCR